MLNVESSFFHLTFCGIYCPEADKDCTDVLWVGIMKVSIDGNGEASMMKVKSCTHRFERIQDHNKC